MPRSSRKHNVRHYMTRREFLWLSSLSAVGALAGCATDPVTGQSQLMLISEDTEIQIDRKNSPLQFSTDYGITQDQNLDDYIQHTGKKLAALSHRPHMPYTFHVVNATYVNAYAFPGGSIAATRGILLELENEAELAALLGHELGHVNSRHTAEQMSKGVLTQAILTGASAYAGAYGAGYGRLVSQLGMIGAGAFLASYSRENEREADDLGMEYMAKAGYGSAGFVGLMEMLNSKSKHQVSSFQLLFATHPMSAERYHTAAEMARIRYAYAENRPLYRERYMDHTAKLRSVAGAIREIQKGDREMGKSNYPTAETHFYSALKQAPGDYTGLVMMAKCMLAQRKIDEALRYAEEAKSVYPGEAQSYHLAGFAKIKKKRFDSAYHDFSSYDRLLPGNPNTVFFKGVSLEGMQSFEQAAGHYSRYLQSVREGPHAQYAYKRLVQWGYVR